MANLLKWGKDRLKQAQGVVAQINPADNNRTYKTVMNKGAAYAPSKPSSAIRQLTHNGVTNVAGEIVKAPVRLSMAYSQALGNLGTMAAGGKSQNADEFYGKRATQLTGYTGTKRQITGDAISTVANVAMPGSSKVLSTAISQAAKRVAPQIIQKATPQIVKKVAPRVISNAAVAAPGGAVSNVGSLIASDNVPLTRENIVKSAKDGAKTAALVGAGLPVAGAIAKPIAKAAVKGAKKTAVKTAQVAQKSVETPQVAALREHNTLLQQQFERSPDPRVRNAAAKQIAKNNQEINAVMQGGYVKVGKTQPVAPPPIKPPAVKTAAPPIEPPKIPLAPASSGELLPPTPKGIAIKTPDAKQGKTRYASKTVPESEFVSEQVRKDVRLGAPEYNVQTEKARYTDSLKRLKSQGDDTFEGELNTRLQAPNGKITAQDVADGQAYAAVLDMRGDKISLEKATQIYERLSEHLTAAGQTVQAAAILARRTPEGMRYWATKQLNNAGVKMTPEFATKLNTAIKAVAKAKDKNRATFEVTKLVDSQIPSNMGDKIINIWRAGLLTAPTTTFGNILGNSGEALVRKGFVNPVATASDAIMGAFTGKRTMTLGKAGAGTKGFAEGSKTLPEYIKTGYDPRNNQSKFDVKKDINYGNGTLGKAMNKYVNGVYRLMGTADAPFSTLAEKEALSSIAKAEAINRGLKGAERTAFVDNFMANPPESAVSRAVQEADYATFKNKTVLGKAATGMKKPLGAAGDFVVPFTQVPAAIATRLIERTPIGIGKELVKQILAHKNGMPFDQRAMAQAIGNGTFGIMVAGAGMALAKTGAMTFGYPKEEKERRLWELQGKQPYSVRIGDRWYSLNYLQPFGMLLAIGGQAQQDRQDGKSWGDTAIASLGRAGQSINEQSFLKGINTVTSAIADPEISADKVIDSTAGSLVPNLIGSATRAADPVQRKLETPLQGIMSDIPGLRSKTPEKLDVFGDPIPAKDTFANQYLNPLKPSKVRGNQLVDQLAALQSQGQGVMPTQPEELGGKKLAANQKSELSRMSGALTKQKWQELVGSPDFQALDPEQKNKALAALGEDSSAVQKKQFAIANGIRTNDLTVRQRAIAGSYDDPTSYARQVIDKDTRVQSTITDKQMPLYKKASELVPAGYEPLPKNTEVLSLYDKLQVDLGKASSELKKRDLRKEYLKQSYMTQLTPTGKDLFDGDYSVNQKLDAIRAGEISQAELEKAIALDNYLYDKGLSSSLSISKKLRAEFGYGSPVAGSGRGRGRSGRGTAKLPDALVSSAIRIPNIGRARQSTISVKSPGRANFKKARKAIPKISVVSTPNIRVKKLTA